MTVEMASNERKVNGWLLHVNDGTMRKEFTKPFVVFHPMYDGIYYEQHDTEEEAMAFCTEERFKQWCDDYL